MLEHKESKLMLVLKFHLMPSGEWVPVERPAHRIAHILYSIAINDTTAFRLRIVSRDDTYEANADEAANNLVISGSRSDPFDVKVSLRNGSISSVALVQSSVTAKTHIYHAGLRFTLEDLNNQQTRVRVEARLATSHPSLNQNLEALTEKLTRILTDPEERL